MNDLKPCPFCGGEATIRYEPSFGVYYTHCDTCNAETGNTGLYLEKGKAIEAWNTRAGRTCYVVNEMYDDVFGVEIQLSCGHNVPMFRENFNYCPKCGARVEQPFAE